MRKVKRESRSMIATRQRRVKRLSEAVLEWMRLAELYQYPRSLCEILEAALRREYEYGQRRGKS
jgi:hypothetical protein